jgi:hypothetical protein
MKFPCFGTGTVLIMIKPEPSPCGSTFDRCLRSLCILICLDTSRLYCPVSDFWSRVSKVVPSVSTQFSGADFVNMSAIKFSTDFFLYFVPVVFFSALWQINDNCNFCFCRSSATTVRSDLAHDHASSVRRTLVQSSA